MNNRMVPVPLPPLRMSDRHLVNTIKYTSGRLDSLEREAAARNIPPEEAQRRRTPPKNPCRVCLGSGVQHPENNGKQFNCKDCKKPGGSFMLKDRVWREAVPHYVEQIRALKEEHGEEKRFLVHFWLCFSCVEKRLGRKLTPEDFNLSLPINQGILLGMKMASRA